MAQDKKMFVLLLVDVRSFMSGSTTEAMAMFHQELAMVHKAMVLARISMVSLTFRSGDNQCVVPFGLHFRCNRFGTICYDMYSPLWLYK